MSTGSDVVVTPRGKNAPRELSVVLTAPRIYSVCCEIIRTYDVICGLCGVSTSCWIFDTNLVSVPPSNVYEGSNQKRINSIEFVALNVS